MAVHGLAGSGVSFEQFGHPKNFLNFAADGSVTRTVLTNRATQQNSMTYIPEEVDCNTATQ